MARGRSAAPALVLGLAFMFCACLPAHPVTLFLAVAETVDSRPGPLPPPVTEGIFDAMFEAGHIVFNTPDGSEIPQKPELISIAVSGGAGYVLEVRVTYTRTPLSEGVYSVDASASYNLFSARSGKLLAAGILTDTNRGSEKEVNLEGLGFRLGGKVVARASEGLEPRVAAGEKES
jgi:hypothetical protein